MVVVREYKCGCKITSEKSYPSIEYCPKHKAAPDLYEVLRLLASQYAVPSNKVYWEEALKVLAEAGRR